MSDTGENSTTENDDQDAGPPGNGAGDVPHPDPDPAPGESGEEADAPVDGDEVDERSAESFPSSDPPSSYAGPDVPPE